MRLLAEAAQALTDPAPADVSAWLHNLFWLVAGVGATVWLINQLTHRSRQPQPFEVKEHPSFATKDELEEVKGEVASLTDKIERGFNALDDKRRTSISGLHHDLDAKVCGLRSDVFGKINEIESRIDAIPGRTIALLNETKQLHNK